MAMLDKRPDARYLEPDEVALVNTLAMCEFYHIDPVTLDGLPEDYYQAAFDYMRFRRHVEQEAAEETRGRK